MEKVQNKHRDKQIILYISNAVDPLPKDTP